MVEIRKARGTDAEKLLEYCRVIGGESDNLTFGPEGLSFTAEQERDYLESLREADNQLYLVAVENGEVLGTACFNGFGRPRLAHRGEISISVRKSMWGNHIGTRLMEELIRFAKASGRIRIISLEVRSDNARAIALYKKFGFETVGTFRGFLQIGGKDVDCDIMRLAL